MPELRKRKAPELPSETSGKKTTSTKSSGSEQPPANGHAATEQVTVEESIDLSKFGEEIQTSDGKNVTLQSLVEESQSGVVLFTYPKASTPGCTTQACLFRDDYVSLTKTGYAIYGLSTDSPKANTTFKTKQNLPFELLCDPKATLIAAIGMKKSPSGTTRGVFVVDKHGKVKAKGPGGPAATVEMVRKLVGEVPDATSTEGESEAQAKPANISEKQGDQSGQPEGSTNVEQEDKAKAETAAQVADTAEKLDQ